MLFRSQVNLCRFPTTNAFDEPTHAYDQDGFRIICQRIISYQSTGILLDLSLAHTLFDTKPDDFGHVHNDVKYTVYPLTFTRNLGNVQADGLIVPFARRMNLIDARLHRTANPQQPPA